MLFRKRPKKRIPQGDMTEGGVVALWAGQHKTELDLDEYLNFEFEKDFGFDIEDGMLPEIDARKVSVPLRELFKEFSFFEHWYESAMEKLGKRTEELYSSGVVFYYLRYNTEKCMRKKRPELEFLGNFNWTASLSAKAEKPSDF